MQTHIMQILANSDADYLFLAALCGLKGLAFERGSPTASGLAQLKWKQSTITGLETAALGLETLLPEPGLFPNGNAGMPIALMHWRTAMLDSDNLQAQQANLLLIDRQLQDGRDFLQGSKAGFADLCAFSWADKHLTSNGAARLNHWAVRMRDYAETVGTKTCADLNSTTFNDPILCLHIDQDSGHAHLTSTLA